MVGAYDVAAVARVTLGFCRTRSCADASAANVLGARPHEYYNDTHVGLLTYAGPAGGADVDASTRRHVSVDDEDLLALGRATLADPAWLTAGGGANVSSWRLRATLSLRAGSSYDVDGPEAVAAPLGDEEANAYGVDLGDPTAATVATTSSWLQSVAYVLCAPPRSSFVVAAADAGLCGPASPRVYPPSHAPDASVPGQHVAHWTFDPDAQAGLPGRPGRPVPPDTEPLRPCHFSALRDGYADAPRPLTPAWLAGRGQREINPAAAGEVALGHAISACAHEVDAPDESGDGGPGARLGDGPPPFVRLGHAADIAPSLYAPVNDELVRLSQQYDQSRWGEHPPAEPATNAAITLAIIVVIPEAMALVALLLTNPRWGRRDWLAFLLIWIAGGVSISGLIALAVDEAAGRRWRGAAERVDVVVPLLAGTPGIPNRRLDRAPLYKVETLLLAARLGYRDRFLRVLAAAVSAAYMVLSVAVAALAVCQTPGRRQRRRERRERRRQLARAGGGGGGGGGIPTAPWTRRRSSHGAAAAGAPARSCPPRESTQGVGLGGGSGERPAFRAGW
ncbi:hypothetical protein I4F81_011296 [Pyropia yezoensis]|uniref:Uncharacterized protein n=1 Tax=Pyropia yezoensis TaxID=2788 RepID=A0ACC3CG22_PYRYE|nr:hypothetical protein I4F81_011296 [Neopyropia yezoensis]